MTTMIVAATGTADPTANGVTTTATTIIVTMTGMMRIAAAGNGEEIAARTATNKLAARGI